STGQSGHWLQFAEDVSRRDRYGLDQDIKLFFCVANVVFDAFIASWDAKRFYDTGRPYWWVRIYHKGQQVDGWLGPGKGSGRLRAEDWHPYSPATFVTPPFPGYTSGHATASGAASRILELLTGSDRYGAVAIQQVGYLTEPEYSTAQMQARDGRPAADVPESKEIRLALPSFTATAEMAAVSRLWGGYHIRFDNEEGLILGRAVAMHSWPIYQAYFDGTAPARGAT
ncbi:MAG TPA: vanadium-dependent haloperoxidase, partial [Solirubrobacterales bacterium]|nr:vanadium-dependent haloperoxidase [Solirubrobacterales bacterium]